MFETLKKRCAAYVFVAHDVFESEENLETAVERCLAGVEAFASVLVVERIIREASDIEISLHT